MKLLQLLKTSLKTWPAGVKFIAQGSLKDGAFNRGALLGFASAPVMGSAGWSTRVSIAYKGSIFMMCDDADSAVVSKAEWQQAIAAQPGVDQGETSQFTEKEQKRREALRAIIKPVAKKISADVWTRHRGRNMPLTLKADDVVDVRLRNCNFKYSVVAGEIDWPHRAKDNDIMGYRLSSKDSLQPCVDIPSKTPSIKKEVRKQNSLAAKRQEPVKAKDTPAQSVEAMAAVSDVQQAAPQGMQKVVEQAEAIIKQCSDQAMAAAEKLPEAQVETQLSQAFNDSVINEVMRVSKHLECMQDTLMLLQGQMNTILKMAGQGTEQKELKLIA